MDFVHDQLADGRSFRVLTVVDNWSRESVLLEAGIPESPLSSCLPGGEGYGLVDKFAGP
jgi:hypothetical protein